MKNKATALLYKEHEVIEDALSAVDAIVQSDIEGPSFRNKAKRLIEFFREYGDTFHHQKEEQLLFPAMAARNELVGESVIGEMLENHTEFREMLKRAQDCLDAEDDKGAKEELTEYSGLLRDHIAVENDELFPMADSLFTEAEAQMMGHRYQDVDRDLGSERKSELITLVDSVNREVHL